MARPVAALRPARRAIALIRVSKERDGMTSPEVQRHAIESYAAANQITIVDTIEGIDESGSRSKSAWWPRLDHAIARMGSGEFNTILVWKYSRTARNRLRWAIALDMIDAAGGSIISATEPIESDTASGKFARGMLGELNAYQADLISESWKDTHARRLREGKPATGRDRFGYVRNREADTYEIDPTTAPIVAELYRRSLAGHGMATLTRWLNSTGTTTRNGKLWQTTSVKRVLDRGFAAGLLWTRGEFLPGAHEPIIDGDVWDAYRAKRAQNAPGPRGTALMVSGLPRCSCGATMMMARSAGGTGEYSCSRRTRGDDSCTTRSMISRRLLEEFVTAWIIDLPERLEVLREVERRQSAQRSQTIEDRAALARLIMRAEARLSTMTVKLLDEKITQAAYDATAAGLNADLASLRARHLRAAPMPTEGAYDHIPTLVDGWSEHTPQTQNRIARQLIDRILILPPTAPGPGVWKERIKIIPKWDATNN